MKDFKDFIAGIGEINVIAYLIYVCTDLAPLGARRTESHITKRT